MKLTTLAITLLMQIAIVHQASAITMTFDDIPEGGSLGYYSTPYNGTGWGINFTSFDLADHTGSTWGTPHSGGYVALYSSLPGHGGASMMFKKWWVTPPEVLYASSVSGYFSTEPGVVLQMLGRANGSPVTAPVLIGSAQGWTNVFVQLDFPAGMSEVSFEPLIGDAQWRFCGDDITIDFVPEPSSLLALGMGGLGMLGMAIRRRRSR